MRQPGNQAPSELNATAPYPLDFVMTMTGPAQPASDPKLRPVAASQAMPPGLLAAIYPYDRVTRDRIHAAWARLSESERQEYREFIGRRFAWPSHQRRCAIAAATLAQND